MQYDHTISGLLKKRDELMGEMQAHRKAMACLHNDMEAIDRVLTAMGYVGDLEARTGRSNRLVIFYRNELRQWLLRELRGRSALLTCSPDCPRSEVKSVQGLVLH